MTNTDLPAAGGSVTLGAPAIRPTNRVPGLGDVGDVRTWLTVMIVLAFCAAYALNWYKNDSKALDLMNGALIAQFTGVAGYWLGSSRNSDAQASTISTLATTASGVTPTTVVATGGDPLTTTVTTSPKEPA